MSLNTEGVSCVRCHAYLFPEDDIVYCPVCGAPPYLTRSERPMRSVVVREMPLSWQSRETVVP